MIRGSVKKEPHMAAHNGGLKSMAGGDGAKILVGYPRDNSSHSVKNPQGGSMGGGLDNLSHSFKNGASAQLKGAKGSGKDRDYRL